MKKVTTAIIFAAGFGSRMLPAAAAIEKVLLPVLNRPIIDYVVADCVAAGINRIIFVIAKDSQGLKNLYLGNPTLEHYLTRYNKTEALDQLHAIQQQATFEFVDQPEEGGYGTAFAVKAALPLLAEGESAFISDGDTFSWHQDGQNEVTKLIQLFESTGADGAIMGQQRDTDELSRYGVLDIRKTGDNEYLQGLVEKPAPGTAPSNLINISKYIITPTLQPYIEAVKPDPKSGEYYLTDAFHAAAHDQTIAIHRADGKLLDAGTVEGWLEANLTLARAKSLI